MSDYESIFAILGLDALLLFFTAVFILMAGFITAALYILVVKMAEARKRDVAIWVLLSVAASPLLMIIILFFIGEEDKKELKSEA
jgi:hypothetical protein